jgi:hypothetical protein
MPDPEEHEGVACDRRALLAGGAGAVAAGLVASRAGAQTRTASAASSKARGTKGLGKVVLET